MNKNCKALLFSVSLIACSASPPPVAAPSPATPTSTSVVPQPIAVAPSAAPAPAVAPAPPAPWSREALALPGAVAPVSLDYLFYEPAKGRVWVPAGGTGSVAVFDTVARSFTRVEGFKTAEREAHGNKRVVGPSSGSVGNGVVYIGNRASQEVCAVDSQTLALGKCLKLASPPDGVQFVAATHEVWVTTPKTQSLVVLDASQPGSLRPKASISLPGDPEGYAVDEAHGLFFTNLEDKGSTLSIDVATRRVKDTWNAGCSSDGPRGLALDSARGLLLVACTDHVQVLDLKHDGARLGSLDTGAGLDNLDYSAKTGLVYAAAGKVARLTVARVGDHGELSLLTQAETAPGARNAVVDANGVAYVADAQAARLLLLAPSKD